MGLLLTSFGDVMAYIGYIALAIMVLLIMIMAHEFGHYIVGKFFHFGIEEFSVGFGPKIISRKAKNGEIISLRAFPLGGFCAFTGEDKDGGDDPKAFNNFHPMKRFCVLIAGALMNFIVSILIVIISFSAYGRTSIIIGGVYDDGNPQNNFEYCDVLLKVEGKSIFLTTDIMSGLEGKKADDIVKFLVVRSGEEKEISVRLREDANFESVQDIEKLYKVLGAYYELEGEGGIKGQLYSTSIRRGFFATIGESFVYSGKIAGTIFTVFNQLFNGRIGFNSVGGTVTTVVTTANAVKSGGLFYLLYIASFIGINLGIFNLLPIPALDGSKALLAIIEWIRKKPLNRKVENIIHTVGFVVIILFAIFVDLQQCF